MNRNSLQSKKSFLLKYRYWILGGAVLLFLPPLAVIFQCTGDSNFCGTWCPRMFLVWRKSASVATYVGGFFRSYMGALLVGGVLAATFFLGRYFCSHICPVGGTMELGSKVIPKRLKINYAKIPAPYFRTGYLVAYFGVAASGIGSLCCNYCNFATIPRMVGSVFSKADAVYFFRTAALINLGVIVVLGFLSKGGRAYCNLLCPIGALDAISNRIGARFGRRIRVKAQKCSGCGKCEKICPLWAIDVTEKAKINQISCMPCGLCEDVCPEKAIGYGGKGMEREVSDQTTGTKKTSKKRIRRLSQIYAE